LSAGLRGARGWGPATYGDPCRQCGYRWDLSLEEAAALIRSFPGRYRQALQGRGGTERHPDLTWSAGDYVCHVADNLSIWADRLERAAAGESAQVTPYDPNRLAAERGYALIHLAEALGALERSAVGWGGAASAAIDAGVILNHPERGALSILDVARTNAHDTAHHLWDITRCLQASLPGRPQATGIQIRAVCPAEHGAVGDLLVASYDTIEGAQVDPEYNQEMRDVAARLAHSEVLVAVDDAGQVLGTITYLPRPGPLSELAGADEGEFRMFAVAAIARGHGVGRRLVQTCLDRSRQQRLRRVWLSTSPWMTDAQYLYESLGFHRVPARDHSEVSSGLTFELLAYVLDL